MSKTGVSGKGVKKAVGRSEVQQAWPETQEKKSPLGTIQGGKWVRRSSDCPGKMGQKKKTTDKPPGTRTKKKRHQMGKEKNVGKQSWIPPRSKGRSPGVGGAAHRREVVTENGKSSYVAKKSPGVSGGAKGECCANANGPEGISGTTTQTEAKSHLL